MSDDKIRVPRREHQINLGQGYVIVLESDLTRIELLAQTVGPLLVENKRLREALDEPDALYEMITLFDYDPYDADSYHEPSVHRLSAKNDADAVTEATEEEYKARLTYRYKSVENVFVVKLLADLEDDDDLKERVRVEQERREAEEKRIEDEKRWEREKKRDRNDYARLYLKYGGRPPEEVENGE